MPTTSAFGDLLKSYRRRKPGLTQKRLAHMTGYNEAVLARMVRGKKDLTGPSGRDRVVQLIDVLCTEGVLSKLAEANALLDAASMPPLYAGLPLERQLISRLKAPDYMPVPARIVNLPKPLTELIGRTEDLDVLLKMLRRPETRLLTLVG